MRTLVIILSFLTLAVTAAPLKDPAFKDDQPNLKTEMNFEDLVVRGKYQYADEAVAAVEVEKTLDDLIGLRVDFKDRLRRETKRK